VEGSNAFDGQWADLTSLVEAAGYDLTQYPEAAVNFYRVEGQGLVGLPFGVFPSAIFYNRDLFDVAGIPYPPHEFGATYTTWEGEEVEWDMDALADVAMLLTIDASGNDATMAEFDPENVVQWGFVHQWTDTRGIATFFGAGNFVDTDFATAIIPEAWAASLQWYYDGIWVSHFIPNGSQVGSDALAAGNPFSSGNVAMASTHLWYTCCLGEVANWDAAAVPSYNGTITAKLHADTFRILASTDTPAESFEVLSYLLGEAAPTLLQVYGGMPARPEEQEAFFATLDETYPQGVDWQVFVDALNYPDNPNHQANMPNYNQAVARSGAFQTLIENTPDLDLTAELETLRTDMQAIFDGTYVEPTE
jgi:multiple sugar transport system substrate-binding protein